MSVNLVDIACVKKEWQTAHTIKALEVNGKSPALAALADWCSTNQRDYKRLMRSIRIVCETPQVRNPKYIKKSSNPKHGDVYEIRADQGLPRLFCFFDRDGRSLVVCTHGWGKKSSSKQQDAEFAKCFEFKKLYEAR